MCCHSWVKGPAEKSFGHVQEWEGAQERDAWRTWRTQSLPLEYFPDRKEDDEQENQKRSKLHRSCGDPADCNCNPVQVYILLKTGMMGLSGVISTLRYDEVL